MALQNEPLPEIPSINPVQPDANNAFNPTPDPTSLAQNNPKEEEEEKKNEEERSSKKEDEAKIKEEAEKSRKFYDDPMELAFNQAGQAAGRGLNDMFEKLGMNPSSQEEPKGQKEDLKTEQINEEEKAELKEEVSEQRDAQSDGNDLSSASSSNFVTGTSLASGFEDLKGLSTDTSAVTENMQTANDTAPSNELSSDMDNSISLGPSMQM